MGRKNPAYKEWENKTDIQIKREYRELIDLVKNFRKKHKIRVFLVNRELKKKGVTKKPNLSEKRARLKKRA